MQYFLARNCVKFSRFVDDFTDSFVEYSIIWEMGQNALLGDSSPLLFRGGLRAENKEKAVAKATAFWFLFSGAVRSIPGE